MTNKYDIVKMQERLQKRLTEDRYQHTLGVMYTCASLAMRYDCDVEKAMVAGVLHDCAKCLPNEKKKSICEKNGIEITDAEQKNLHLLHAKAGAFLAKTKYGVNDEEILGAIRYHTTGKADMTLLEKITYLADYIEPWRQKAPNLKEIRKEAYCDLDDAIYRVFHDTLQYLQEIQASVDPTTRQAYEFYRDLYQRRHQTEQ